MLKINAVRYFTQFGQCVKQNYTEKDKKFIVGSSDIRFYPQNEQKFVIFK